MDRLKRITTASATLTSSIVMAIECANSFNRAVKAMAMIEIDNTSVLNYYSFCWNYPVKRHYK